MAKPTKDAVAGRYQSISGNDFVQFVDKFGEVVSWVDSSGVLRGSVQQILVSNSNDIDAGTF